MALARVSVQPSVLRWARETAGLDVETAAGRIGVQRDRLGEWEDGAVAPTIRQLRTMADVYVRPLAALFLPEPLADDVRPDLPDFRRPEVRARPASRSLQRAVMRAHRQQEALRDVAADLEQAEVSARISLDRRWLPATLGRELRTALGLDSISKSVLRRPEQFLRELVRRVEDLNVTVIQVQRVEIAEMRGFALGEGTCPVIALNGADWPPGKVYTLLHELAHVGLRSSGLCDLRQPADERTERLCDAAAAAALMPAPAVLKALGSPDSASTVGAEFGVSGESALIRMIELGRATWDDHRRLKPEFDEAYASFKAAQRERSADSPIYYQVKRRDLGRRFISQMMSAHQENALSSRDLAHLLEVPYDKLPKLVGEIA